MTSFKLYIKLYPETLQGSGSAEALVTKVWELLNGGKLPGISDDGVRSSSSNVDSSSLGQTVIALAGIASSQVLVNRDPVGSLQGPIQFPRYYLYACARRRCSQRRTSR